MNIANFVLALDATVDALFAKMGMSSEPPTVEEMVLQTFPNSQVVSQPAFQPAQGGQVRIKGTQHGPIPAWLHTECAKKGVTEVWDNRDGLTVSHLRSITHHYIKPQTIMFIGRKRHKNESI
jgi:hypothetical protein